MTALMSGMFYASDDHASILKCDDWNALLQVRASIRTVSKQLSFVVIRVSSCFCLAFCSLCENRLAATPLHLTQCVSFSQSNRAFCNIRHVSNIISLAYCMSQTLYPLPVAPCFER
jgi:hypothetical protein